MPRPTRARTGALLVCAAAVLLIPAIITTTTTTVAAAPDAGPIADANTFNDNDNNNDTAASANTPRLSPRAARVPREAAPHLAGALRYHEVLSASDVSHVHVQRRRRRSTFEEELFGKAEPTSEHHEVRFSAHGRVFDLRLVKNHRMFAHGIRARIIDENGKVTPFRVDAENYLVGHDMSDEANSHANLYIRDGVLAGFMHVHNNTFFVERSLHHYPNDSSIDMIVYRAADVRTGDWRRGLNATGHSFCGADHHHTKHQDTISRMTAKERRKYFADLNNSSSGAGSAGGDGDQAAPDHHDHDHDHNDHDDQHDHHAHGNNEYEFPQLYGEQQAHVRARRARPSETDNTCLVSVVADARFHAFHNNERADTTQSMLQHFAIADDIFSSTVFAGDIPSGLSLFVHEVTIRLDNFVSTTSVTEMLSDFSSTIDFSSSCVAHLFTRVDFTGGTLGLAWVGSPDANRAGGICHSSRSQWLNTGLTSNINFGENVPFATTSLVTSHEVGHNWGSSHDDPEDPVCAPDELNGGKYLMFAVAVDGSQDNNQHFSPCSRELIAAVLRVKGTCFAPQPAGVCGNGKVETDPTGDTSEECDAGGEQDQCCNSACELKRPNGQATQCTALNNICCDSATCSFYADNTHQCYEPFDLDPLCRGVGMCVGGECQDPPPPKAAGEPCSNGGRCQEVADPDKRCITFCERFGATQCTCTGSDECSMCCEHNPDADCSGGSNCGCPFQDFDGCVPAMSVVTQARVSDPQCYADDPNDAANTRYEDNPILQPCTEPDVNDCLHVLDLPPGTPCSSGQCNRQGQCERAASGIARFWDPDNFSLDSLKLWARNNIVGAVMIVALLLWIPAVCLIKRYDHKQRELNAAYGTRRTASTMKRKKHPRQGGAVGTAGRRRRSKDTSAAARGPRPRRDGRGGPAPSNGLAGSSGGGERRRGARAASTRDGGDRRRNGSGSGSGSSEQGNGERKRRGAKVARAREQQPQQQPQQQRQRARQQQQQQQQKRYPEKRAQALAAHDKPQPSRQQQQQQQHQLQQQQQRQREQMQRRQQQQQARLQHQSAQRQELARRATSGQRVIGARPPSTRRNLPSNPPPYTAVTALDESRRPTAPSSLASSAGRRPQQQQGQHRPTQRTPQGAGMRARAHQPPQTRSGASSGGSGVRSPHQQQQQQQQQAYPRYNPGVREPVQQHSPNTGRALPNQPRRIVARGPATSGSSSASSPGHRQQQQQQQLGHRPTRRMDDREPRRHVIQESSKGRDLVFD
ncbi:ADAM-17 protein [Salpingoeca rosetta]|uniref:ADAM-17 protein n=1 Tax=Salpingoeca rosetta (strain ATCC 50818 / BSB-021) TaxID=946362 RepID=F2UCI9_SALR5|nr:ADAM-17 protein [Salpingoeca rosetta]EGD74296.1 ADAM-17 protein [Salpingoeca rosetta]|eukprot:XP_004993196.1 ADAM-17 protein [Salpingoeca rosetta]